MFDFTRAAKRAGALLAAAVFLAALTPASADNAAPKTLRIGYQKIGDLLLLKEQGTLEKRLGKDGIAVEWVQFQSGPPLLEALNAGSIDLGYTGDTPPIFAQAAGTDLVYVASTPNRGRGAGIVVHGDGSIKTIADLRGKKLAFTRGSSAHNFVVKALEKGGLKYDDVQIVNLQPADAAAAFQNGSIDAWAIWDPFFALAERYPNARVLTSAQGVATTNVFYLARREFAARAPHVIAAAIDELDRTSRWAHGHLDEAAADTAKVSGLDVAVEKVAAARKDSGVHPLTADVVREQQSIADVFAKLGLIPHAVDVRSIVWTGK
jgi:sulfonate transport system substrate-binding protein